MPENSGIWKARFLYRYDSPFIAEYREFCNAYQLRRFVLRKFVGFESGGVKGRLGLEVLRDMVIGMFFLGFSVILWALPASFITRHSLPNLRVFSCGLTNPSLVVETYNICKTKSSAPSHSHNLSAFSAALTSPWMKVFLESPLFAHLAYPPGQPNRLFDVLQLVLSHLVLNPPSSFGFEFPTSSTDYHLERVYNWHGDFQTLYRRVPSAEQPAPADRNLPIFPNMKSPELEPQMQLDSHTLLHIRNFWRRHFSMHSEDGAVTYANMAMKLGSRGSRPTEWDRALQNPLVPNGRWVGHYSCLHPWPKSRQDMEARQSCAEDWIDGVDPLVSFVNRSDPSAPVRMLYNNG